MENELAYDIQKNLEDIVKDLDTITKMHVRLDELSSQLSEVVHLAGGSYDDTQGIQSSAKLMELVNVLLNKVELGIYDLEQRVSSIENIRNRLRS
jgi:hypothetical protein